MTMSAAVQDPSLNTWIYFDALNFGSPDFVEGPLENVFNADGTAITEKYEGSQYLVSLELEALSKLAESSCILIFVRST